MIPRYFTLGFQTLRRANLARLPQFKNRKGEPAHAKDDGSDWSPADWMTATVGELGELANVMKKFRRGDLTASEFKLKAAQELADTQIYLDLLAANLGIDLGLAVRDTFNKVSLRVGSSIYIDEAGQVWDHGPAGLSAQCDGGHDGPACLDPACFIRRAFPDEV